MPKNNIKKIRVNNEVKRCLSTILEQEIKDDRIHEMTSIVAVNVTPDLKYCKVEVSVLGNDLDRERTLEGLNSAKGFIRSKLAKKLNLRNTPELNFVSNSSIEYAINMGNLIDKVIGEDEIKRNNIE